MPVRSWLPANSDLRLELGLALARLEPDFLPIFAIARDVEQLDEARYRPPFMFGRQHHGPAIVVILRVPDATPIANLKGFDARREAELAEWIGQEGESGPEAGVDPAAAVFDEAHAGAPRQRLCLELADRAEVRDQRDLIEARQPAPFKVLVDVLRVLAVVISERLQAHRNRGRPG